jgi:hypothetical protein
VTARLERLSEGHTLSAAVNTARLGIMERSHHALASFRIKGQQPSLTLDGRENEYAKALPTFSGYHLGSSHQIGVDVTDIAIHVTSVTHVTVWH